MAPQTTMTRTLTKVTYRHARMVRPLGANHITQAPLPKLRISTSKATAFVQSPG
jgi:hypothetical protein